MIRITLYLLVLMSYWMFAQAWAGLPETIDKIRPSIVAIGTYQATRPQQLHIQGTGFIVMDGRHVVTNYHVVSKELNLGKEELRVVLIGHGPLVKWYRLQQVAKDIDHDLALFSFDGPRQVSMRLNPRKHIREGERYAFTGYPIAPVLGLYPVTHRAIVSAITPMVGPENNSNQLTAKQIIKLRASSYNVYQLDANAYPGNSGSPVYDPQTGAVIAILNSVYVKEYRENSLLHPSGISYAIPVKYLSALIDRAKLNLSK